MIWYAECYALELNIRVPVDFQRKIVNAQQLMRICQCPTTTSAWIIPFYSWFRLHPFSLVLSSRSNVQPKAHLKCRRRRKTTLPVNLPIRIAVYGLTGTERR